jgi:4-alpha-glucanotransferase
MKVHFNLEYHAVFGEDLLVEVRYYNSSDVLIKDVVTRMFTEDGFTWKADQKVPSGTPTHAEYEYSVNKEGQKERQEWSTEPHLLELNNSMTEDYVIYDRWIDIPEDSYLYSSAITECVQKRKLSFLPEKATASVVRLKVRAPQLHSGQHLTLVGGDRALGEWDISKGIRMTEHNYNEWVVDIDADVLSRPLIEFKLVATDDLEGGNTMWEDGSNRSIMLPKLTKGETVVYELIPASFSVYGIKCAGTLVPVFSLRSRTSFGVGDFGDLTKMVDWVSSTGQRLLQVLPINDTTITHTWTDSYPYSCISIFALHPQYADFTALPALKDAAAKKRLETERKELNALRQIDYERVNKAKDEYLRLLYMQEGKTMMASDAYKKFFAESCVWLVPYAQYCYLRDKNGTADFSKWKGHSTFSEKDRKPLSTPTNAAYKEVAFYYFVQYILNSQMEAVHDYARAKGVILKGDIPIGVNRYGCDVWQEPRYFNLNGQAGAPPDDFSVNGQNWGFPTYNWDEMIKDGCQWWIRRFSNMAKYFDAYRIDHILGFFRIWEIPTDSVHGLLGQFAPSLGMTREEIESYGLNFQEELFTRPFITDWVIDRVFKQHADQVRTEYLEHIDADHYQMKAKYDTQRKVEAAFEGRTSDDDVWIRDGLYSLISDVLFVRDHKDKNKFHPRISVQFSFIYESLYDSDKAIFNRLYNDYFYRRNNQFWYREAMKKLPKLVQATRMLVCGEDLGMVPDCVPWVMNELRILSLELQSMPKDPTVRFGHLSRNPYRSVCTISSHDMPTLRQWWDEDINRTQEYYNTMLHRGGAAPHPLPGWLASDIISRHLTSPSMLCILSIQDWMAIDEKLRLADQNAERINIPANPHHYWRYRMHVSIEELMDNRAFNENVSELILQAGRKFK